MAVMAREAWTDERLDDLAKRMDKGFSEVKGEIRELRADTDAGIGELRKEMNSRFNSVDARFDALQRTMVLSVVGMSASIVGALLATQL
ncbi:MAG: hypothetical protein M3335_03165 [Actinomycetota bacterium]|nr:hypothetical protein [Actinomycetota bacterium]